MSRRDDLRRAFDASFAVAPAEASARGEPFVLLGCGEISAAVPLTALSGVHPLPPITRLPGGPSGLLGVGTLRGAIVAVWALGDLLGQPRADTAWVLTSGADLGLAFERFEGWLVVPADRVFSDERGGRVLQLDGSVRPILDLDGMARLIRTNAERLTAPQEPR